MKTEFYKMEYEAWDEGTDDLTLEQEAAYLRICHQMYRRRGPVKESKNMLARIWRCHPNKAMALLEALIAAGKVERLDGHLVNKRVRQELDHRETVSRKRSDQGRTGGIRSGEVRRNPLKNNNRDEAVASASVKQNEAEERRGEENRGDSPHSPPKGGGELPLESQNGKRQSTPRGTYLPEDWEPPEKERLWAKGEYGLTDAQLNKITAEFRDYWCGEAGQRARKRDWSKTWRNRVRQVAPRLAKDEIPKPRRNGTGWVVMHGCEQYWPWRDRYRQENNPKMYEFKDTPGTEVHVPTLWPGGRI